MRERNEAMVSIADLPSDETRKIWRQAVSEVAEKAKATRVVP